MAVILVAPWPQQNPTAIFDQPPGTPSGPPAPIPEMEMPLDASTFAGATAMAKLQACRDACISQNKIMYVPAGDWNLTGTLDINDSGFRMIGDGPSTRIIANGDYDAVVIGLNSGGPPIAPGGWCKDLQIYRAVSRPNNGCSGLTIRRNPEFVTDGVVIHQGFDVAFDYIDNCYMARMYNCRATFGGNNVGLYLRTGIQSGSDLSFVNNNLAGFKSAVWAERDGGGYRFWGGQMSAGDTDPNDQPQLGIITLGKDYLPTAGANVGGVPAVTLVGVSFEGGWRRWIIWCQEKAWVEMIQCNYNMVQGGANAMLGILGMAAAGDSKLAFRSGSYHGNPPKTALKQIAGSFGGFALLEELWRDLPGGVTTM